jgi:hypothetical protein
MTFKVGWLTKQGGTVFTNWKRRFFKLDETAGTLSYFESNNPNEKVLGVVVIKGATVAMTDKGEKGKFNFTIVSRAKDKVFHAYSDNKEEAEDWVKKLNQFIYIYIYIINFV